MRSLLQRDRLDINSVYKDKSPAPTREALHFRATRPGLEPGVARRYANVSLISVLNQVPILPKLSVLAERASVAALPPLT
jgi:hypothetical protein